MVKPVNTDSINLGQSIISNIKVSNRCPETVKNSHIESFIETLDDFFLSGKPHHYAREISKAQAALLQVDEGEEIALHNMNSNYALSEVMVFIVQLYDTYNILRNIASNEAKAKELN